MSFRAAVEPYWIGLDVNKLNKRRSLIQFLKRLLLDREINMVINIILTTVSGLDITMAIQRSIHLSWVKKDMLNTHEPVLRRMSRCLQYEFTQFLHIKTAQWKEHFDLKEAMVFT